MIKPIKFKGIRTPKHEREKYQDKSLALKWANEAFELQFELSAQTIQKALNQKVFRVYNNQSPFKKNDKSISLAEILAQFL